MVITTSIFHIRRLLLCHTLGKVNAYTSRVFHDSEHVFVQHYECAGEIFTQTSIPRISVVQVAGNVFDYGVYAPPGSSQPLYLETSVDINRTGCCRVAGTIDLFLQYTAFAAGFGGYNRIFVAHFHHYFRELPAQGVHAIYSMGLFYCFICRNCPHAGLFAG